MPQSAIAPRCDTNPSSVISAWQSYRSISPDVVFSIVTASMWPSPCTSRTSCGVRIRTAPSPSSRRASFTDDSSARNRSRRWTSVIGRSAVSWRPSVQSRAESPPPTITQLFPANCAFSLTT